MKHFYVYVLLDTRKPGNYSYGKYNFDYKPFYVGKGKGDRHKSHFSHRSLKSNSLKNKKIRNILKATGEYPAHAIVYDKLSDERAYTLEQKVIRVIGRLDRDSGPLVNLTAGGNGVLDINITHEYIAGQRRDTLSNWKNPDVRNNRIIGLNRVWENVSLDVRRARTVKAVAKLAELRPRKQSEWSESIKQSYIDRTPESKAKQHEGRAETLFGTKEKREAWGKLVSKSRAERSDEERVRVGKNCSEGQKRYRKTMTEEQKLEHALKTGAGIKRAWDNSTQEQRRLRSEALSKAHANRTPESKKAQALKHGVSMRKAYANMNPKVKAMRIFRLSLTLTLKNSLTKGLFEGKTIADYEKYRKLCDQWASNHYDSVGALSFCAVKKLMFNSVIKFGLIPFKRVGV